MSKLGLAELSNDKVDAVILAAAGLKRLSSQIRFHNTYLKMIMFQQQDRVFFVYRLPKTMNIF
ncbi:MAG: hypothetical protein CM15mP69_2790 [Ectothiorhodospiraceae bacterium]|nr:MAG: hypothetical protein CM15mP69_2790 [Ectothiorhodospiraceae bacterium]